MHQQMCRSENCTCIAEILSEIKKARKFAKHCWKRQAEGNFEIHIMSLRKETQSQKGRLVLIFA